MRYFKIFWINTVVLLLPLLGCQTTSNDKSNQQLEITTFANPLDLNYRFAIEPPSRREAADPTVVLFQDNFFLFASKSGGYWYSDDLSSWDFIETNEIPTEEYAPTAVAIGDTLYFLASSTEKSTIYKSGNPLSGKWSIAKDSLETPVWDPALFLDDDNRLYLYWGCSNVNPLYGVELDFKNGFELVGEPTILKYPNPDQFGWEVPGDYNTLPNQAPWIEGAWMNKYNDTYYLQYSGPGTEFKSYSDGVYTSASPLGPFTIQKHNPFAYKPEGFAAGAGHGSTFRDRYGNYWHIGTVTISQKHMFERRLALYPAFIDNSGTLYANTKFGDYPYQIPKKKIGSPEEVFPEWMLLSYKKAVEVSSSIDSLSPSFMVDEDIRTYWSAESGNEGEYVVIDLEEESLVNAIQINFAEQGTNLYGMSPEAYHQYFLSYSIDGSTWEVLIDHSHNKTGNSHQYIQINEPVNTRFIKVTNVSVPDGYFAISGLRVFGKGKGKRPEAVGQLEIERDSIDRRIVQLQWESSPDAVGYNVKYGFSLENLYLNYKVYTDTSVVIRSLNKDLPYHFTVEAFNVNGVAPIGQTERVD